MALTRDFLKGFNIDGLSDDFIQKIMDEHGATITANNKAAEDAKNALNNTITDLTSKLNTATSSITTLILCFAVTFNNYLIIYLSFIKYSQVFSRVIQTAFYEFFVDFCQRRNFFNTKFREIF